MLEKRKAYISYVVGHILHLRLPDRTLGEKINTFTSLEIFEVMGSNFKFLILRTITSTQHSLVKMS